MFQLAVAGETVVIQRDNHRVALRSLEAIPNPEVAPPEYFAEDYSPEEVVELNALASQAPRVSLP